MPVWIVTESCDWGEETLGVFTTRAAAGLLVAQLTARYEANRADKIAKWTPDQYQRLYHAPPYHIEEHDVDVALEERD